MTNVVLQENQEKPNFNVFITRENEPYPRDGLNRYYQW